MQRLRKRKNANLNSILAFVLAFIQVAVVCPHAAFGQSPAPPSNVSLSLTDAVDLALKNNL